MAKTNKIRFALFVTFVLSCVSAAMLSICFGSQRWLVADCNNTFQDDGSGNAHFGLFAGKSLLTILSSTAYSYHIVCLENKCMYSAKETKEDRQQSINNTLNGQNSTDILHSKQQNGVTEMVDEEPDLMNEALWIATICLLCGALLFAVIGAVFAVINTATTPIEFITGVPGLYIWNGAAALFGLACAICWGVQYHNHLKSNVLIEDATEGWTTEGLQHLGYSYWLVVVSAIVHLDNCVLIAIGTYERKVKTQYEAPETKPGNIMLY